MAEETLRACRPGRARMAAVTHRWPTLLGLLAAGSQILTGADRSTLGIIVGVATICYLSAAALGRPWMSWAAIPGCSVVIAAAIVAGVAPLTLLAVAAVVLVVAGLVTHASRAALSAQTAAVLVYGGLAVTALAIAPAAGLVLVAVTLIAHGAWDIFHLRRGIVVSASLAEACVALDVPLGLAVLIGLAVA